MIQDAPEYYEYNTRDTVVHYGLRSGQNQTAMLAMSILLDIIKPKNIIEFGTGTGGLSVLIGIWSKLNGANFRTYDNNDQRLYAEIFNKLGIEFICCDVHALHGDIIPHIQQPGVSLVLCDDGNKHQELEEYAPHLKPYDYIMMHDYSRDLDAYNSRIKPKYWDWHESSEFAGTQLGLTPVYERLLEYAVWGCFRKEQG